MTLGECTIGQLVTVKDLKVPEGYRKRLMDLGLLPGTSVKVLRKTAFGGPLILQIRGYQIAIRWTDAKGIHIEPDHS